MSEVMCRRRMAGVLKAADPSTDPELLLSYAESDPETLESPGTRTELYEALLSNPATPVEALDFICHYNIHPQLWKMIVNHPNLTMELFESLIPDEDEDIEEGGAEFYFLLASHRFASEELIVSAISNGTMQSALTLGADPRLSAKTIRKAVKEWGHHTAISGGLVQNPNIDQETLSELISRVSWHYRFFAVTNPSLTAEQVEALKNDTYDWVSTWAKLFWGENFRDYGMPLEWYLAAIGVDLSIYRQSPDGVTRTYNNPLMKYVREEIIEKWCNQL